MKKTMKNFKEFTMNEGRPWKTTIEFTDMKGKELAKPLLTYFAMHDEYEDMPILDFTVMNKKEEIETQRKISKILSKNPKIKSDWDNEYNG